MWVLWKSWWLTHCGCRIGEGERVSCGLFLFLFGIVGEEAIVPLFLLSVGLQVDFLHFEVGISVGWDQRIVPF